MGSAPGFAVALAEDECLDRASLHALQGRRLRELLGLLQGSNPFYTRKLAEAGVDVQALRLPEEIARLPVTTKAELIADQAAHPPWGSALTHPLVEYTRYCQTSSTTGQPLRWLDTNASWQWLLECWKAVYRAAGVGPEARVLFPFSFGPFLGFWAAFDAASQIGVHCIPGGGLSSHLRLNLIDSLGVTVVCCTPTYALRLAEVAAAEGRSLHTSTVRVVIVAGEPGGSLPATRERIETSWGARVIDHHGLTEVGPVSFECWEAPGNLHLIESRYLCEVLEPGGLEPVNDGEQGELVVTCLGRSASPVLRYRTADLVVRRSEPCPCGRSFARLQGGIRARADDMVNIRGVNVYPAAIEDVVRRFPEVAEFRSTVTLHGALRHLDVEIEPGPGTDDEAGLVQRVSERLREALGLGANVRAVPPLSLPRFEMKARRFVVEAERR